MDRGIPFKWAFMQAMWAWQRDNDGKDVSEFPLHPIKGK